jgi:hypothetical protein
MPEQVKVDFGTLNTNVLIGAVLSSTASSTNNPTRNISGRTVRLPARANPHRASPSRAREIAKRTGPSS